MTLHISRQYTYDGPCPQPAEVTTLVDLANGERHWICGCGFCPEPDPTPEQLQQRVHAAAWRRAASTEGRGES
jgi:hypothetical protein